MRTVLGIFTLGAFPLGAATTFDLRVNWAELMPRGIDQRVGRHSNAARGFRSASNAMRQISRERGYVIDASCPNGLTLVFKHVVGIPGDRIQVARDDAAVNGAAVPDSEPKEVDSPGLLLEHTAEGEIVLTEGRFFVMGMNASWSCDSRHFGPVSAHPIVVGARPLWTF